MIIVDAVVASVIFFLAGLVTRRWLAVALPIGTWAAFVAFEAVTHRLEATDMSPKGVVILLAIFLLLPAVLATLGGVALGKAGIRLWGNSKERGKM